MSAIKTLTGKPTHNDGLAIGVAGEKISFFGAAPVLQPSGAAQVAIAAPTYEAPNNGAVNSGDATTDTVITSLRTQLIALAADVAAHKAYLDKNRTDQVALGLIKGAA